MKAQMNLYPLPESEIAKLETMVKRWRIGKATAIQMKKVGK